MREEKGGGGRVSNNSGNRGKGESAFCYPQRAPWTKKGKGKKKKKKSIKS